MKKLVHRTRYAFDDVVEGGELETCLSPRSAKFHQLKLRPLPASVETSRDAYGNERRRAWFDGPLTTLEITATSLLKDRDDHDLDPSLFLAPSPRVPLFEGYGEGLDVLGLLTQISSDFRYDPLATTIDTPLATFFERRRGVCQDFAHFIIACLRARGIPARYVSGYSKASALTGRAHAWACAFVDGTWLDVDPTLGRMGDIAHIALATGRDYDDVPPLRGTLSHRGTCRVVSEITVS